MNDRYGYVDQFRRLTILDKMPKQSKYFFQNQQTEEKTNKYIRKRQQPRIQFDIDDDHQSAQKSKSQNQLLLNVLNYTQNQRLEKFTQIRNEHNQQNRNKIQFANFLQTNTTQTVRQFLFGDQKYRPPPRQKQQATTKKKKVENQKQKIYNQLIANQKQRYDFFLLNKTSHQRRKETDNDDEVATFHYDSNPPKDIKLIQQIKQLQEMKKTFTYQHNKKLFEHQIKHIYPLKYINQSILYSKLQPQSVTFYRDIGNINRKPPISLHHLQSAELILDPNNMKFHDIINIACGRITNQNIEQCIRRKGINKQDYQNARKILQKLKYNEVETVQAQIAAGDQEVKNNDQKIDEFEEKYQTQTQKLINEITDIKFQFKKIEDCSLDKNMLKKQFKNRLHQILKKLFSKVLEGVKDHIQPTLQELKTSIHLISGNTDSGFDRKKLFWLYLDSINLLKLNETYEGENIVNLIRKSQRMNRTKKVTVYRESMANKSKSPIKVIQNNAALKKKKLMTYSQTKLK